MWSVWWQGEPPSPSSTGSPSRCCGDAGGGGSTIGVVVSKGDTLAQPLCLMSSSPNPQLLGPTDHLHPNHRRSKSLPCKGSGHGGACKQSRVLAEAQQQQGKEGVR